MAHAITDFTSIDDIQRYLTLLFPDPPDDAWLVISWLAAPGDFRSQWFLVADMSKAAQRLCALSKECNTYVGLGLRHPRCTPTPASRGTSEDVFALGGLWCELDHSGGVHSATNLPTLKQLTAFVKQLPFQLSLTIDSGGGVHGYLLFKELWILETPEEQTKAATLLRRFQRTLQVMMTAKRWKMDSTADLARVLRPTGTMNHKGETPKPVLLIDANTTRYNPSDLEEAPWLAVLDDMYVPPADQDDFPTTLLAPIETGCAWMAHCRDEAPTLSEPEWYAMLGIVGRCEQGHELAHEWSSPYPGYNARETDKKLAHALNDAGPRTCQKIRYDLDGEVYCRACPSWGKIKSPIRLGMPVALDLDLETPVGFQNRNGHKPATGTSESAKKGTSKPRAQGFPHEQAQWFTDKVEKYRNKLGIIEANDTTICAFLRNHEHWQGKLWWNELANRPMVDDKPLDDHTLTTIGEYFGDQHNLPIRTTGTKLAKCIAAVSYDHKRDPLQEYLDSIAGWDGEPRLEEWLIDCGGVTNTPLHRDISRLLIVSMIARAYEPGCLYRYVVVFEGPEEYRKSTFVANMVPVPEWQDTVTESFESKDMPTLISALWIAELSELDSLPRTEKTRLKSFISKRVDSYVPKWGLFRVSPARRTVFIGTTNDKKWLPDSTGNTRWLPVKVLKRMDVEHFSLIREQLYAEAKGFYYDHPHDWWKLSSEGEEEAKGAREERRQEGVYEDTLGPWLTEGRFHDRRLHEAGIVPKEAYTTWEEIAIGFLKSETPERWNLSLQKNIAQAMTALKWEQKIIKVPDGRDGKQRRSIRVWRPENPLE